MGGDGILGGPGIAVVVNYFVKGMFLPSLGQLDREDDLSGEPDDLVGGLLHGPGGVISGDGDELGDDLVLRELGVFVPPTCGKRLRLVCHLERLNGLTEVRCWMSDELLCFNYQRI